MSAKNRVLEYALFRKRQAEVADARLRLCLRILSMAAEADPGLYEREDFRRGQMALASMLGETAEVPYRGYNPNQCLLRI